MVSGLTHNNSIQGKGVVLPKTDSAEFLPKQSMQYINHIGNILITINFITFFAFNSQNFKLKHRQSSMINEHTSMFSMSIQMMAQIPASQTHDDK